MGAMAQTIILIQPPSREQGKLIYPPLGLMAVAALPDAAGMDVRILDCNVMDMGEVKRIIREADPKLVGVTSFTGPMLANALEMSRYVKSVHPKVPVVWGGVHTSILPEQTLANDCIDICVLFEGDRTFMELCQAEDLTELDHIDGLLYKKPDGSFFKTKPRALIEDLAVLPRFPWQLVDVEKYVIPWAQAKRTLPIISSRGCPYRCTFCYNLVFNEQKWRGFPVERIQEEIDYLFSNYNLDGIRLDASDLFIGPGKQGRDMALAITSHAQSRGLKWACQVRTNQMSVELLEDFKRTGCNYIFYGIESGSKRVLKEIYKDVRLDNIQKVVARTNELGIMSAAGIMYDFPGETMEDFRQTIQLIKDCSILVRFSALQPYPGTPCYDLVRERGLINFPTTTEGWVHFDYNHPHGLSDIPNVKERAGEWNFKYNYAHNLLVTLKRKDWFFLETMGSSFVKYYMQERRRDSYELNY